METIVTSNEIPSAVHVWEYSGAISSYKITLEKNCVLKFFSILSI